MNRSFHNIESRPFPGHAYRVGYARVSGVWHIFNAGKGGWYAVCQTNRSAGVGRIFTSTLAEISSKLDEN